MGAEVDGALGIGAPPEPEVEVDPGAEWRDDGPELLEGRLAAPAHVDEAVVRGLLGAMGHVAGHVAGDEAVPDLWHFTDQELDDLVPPLTRMINRRPALVRAVVRGDEMTVALTFAGYLGRNVADLREAQEARRDGELDRQAARAPGPTWPGAGDNGDGADAGGHAAAGGFRQAAD